MTNIIENIDRRQQRLWRRFLLIFFLGLILLTLRYTFGTVLAEHRLNDRPIGIAVLVVSVALAVMALAVFLQLGLLMRRAARDPELREALIENELVQHHLARSWKAGFIGAVATPFFFLLVSLLYPIHDLLLVALCTGIVGSGLFLLSFYLRSNG